MNIIVGDFRAESLIPPSSAPTQKRVSLGHRILIWLKNPFNRTDKAARAAMDSQFAIQKEAIRKVMIRIEQSDRHQTVMSPKN